MKRARILNEITSSRLGRVFFLAVALFLLATLIRPPPPAPPAGPANTRLDIVPFALDEEDPGRRRVGELVYLRGWTLSSPEPRFGAISAMQVENGQVTALSDTGTIFRFAVPRAAGAAPLRIEPLPQTAGGAKSNHDTEALLLAGGRAWIAFERQNGVVRYRRAGWREESAARPDLMRSWRGNSGPEGMTRLRDGRFLIFSEGRDNDAPFSPVVLFAGDPAEPGTPAVALRYRRQPGFRVTDAAALPDGRLLILNRRFSWFDGASARLVVAGSAGLGPGATIEGREIAELRAPLAVDNMEALSVVREGGRTIVRIASDDNFMGAQRTLLLEFAWPAA
jgi:hypothetical protein